MAATRARRSSSEPAIPKGSKTWPIERLKPDPRNARTHDPGQVTKIAASIAAFGFNAPILVAGDGTVIAGHARLEAARTLKLTRVPVVVLDHLSARDRRAYLLADNRLAELAGWDKKLLGEELSSLARDGLDVATMGWTDQELRDILEADVPELNGRDQVPEPPPEPRTKPGDMWTLGEHRVLCGDATAPASWERLTAGDGDRAQAVFTDPPYGVAYQDSKGTTIRNDRKRGSALEELLSKAFAAVAARAREDAAWYVWHASSARPEFDRALSAAGLVELQMIVWAKPNPNLGHAHYQWSHEACYYASREGAQPKWFGGRDQGTVWRFALAQAEESSTVLGAGVELVAGDARLWLSPRAPGGGTRKIRKVRLEAAAVQVRSERGEGTLWEVSRDRAPEHPTQKPVELALRGLRNSTEPGDVVLDPFGGSGSTLLAAEELGRVARLTELEPRWVDVAVDRWRQATGREPKLESGKRRRSSR